MKHGYPGLKLFLLLTAILLAGLLLRPDQPGEPVSGQEMRSGLAGSAADVVTVSRPPENRRAGSLSGG